MSIGHNKKSPICPKVTIYRLLMSNGDNGRRTSIVLLFPRLANYQNRIYSPIGKVTHFELKLNHFQDSD